MADSFGRVSVMRRGSAVIVSNTHLQVTYELSTGLWSYADASGHVVADGVGARWTNIDGNAYATSDPCRRVFRARPTESPEYGSGAEAIFRHEADEHPAATDLILRVHSDLPFAIVQLRVVNESEQSIRVDRFDVVEVPSLPGIPMGGVALGRDPAECRVFLNGARNAARGVFGCEQNAVYPDQELDEPISDGILYDPRSLRALTFGFLDGGRWWSGVRLGHDARGVEPDPDTTRMNIWNVFQRCDGAWCLRDRTLESERLYVNVSTKAGEAKRHFAATAVGGLADKTSPAPTISCYLAPGPQRPPLAEQVNTFIEALNRKSDHLAAGAGGLGGLRLATGWIGSAPPDLDAQFPDGAHKTAEAARAAGLTVAAEASPFLIRKDVAEHFEEPLLRFQSGAPADLLGEGQSDMRALDPTHPGTRDLLAAQIRRICGEWGFDALYVSLAPFRDFVAYDVARHRWHEPNLTRMQIIHRAYDVLNSVQQEVAPDAWLAWIDIPQSVALAGGHRSTAGLDYFYRAKPQVWSGQWGMRELIRAYDGKAYLHGSWSDVELGPIRFLQEQTRNESQLLLTVGLMSGGHLCVADELAQLDLDDTLLLAQCLPLMDRPARAVPLDNPMLHAWMHPVRAEFGDWDLLAVANLSDLYEDVEVPLADVGLSRARTYIAYEVWDRAFYGVHQRSLSVTGLPPRAAKLFVLREEADVPILIASDLHASQASDELLTVGWDARTESLLGGLRRIPHETGTLFLYVPDMYLPTGVSCVGAKYSYMWRPPVLELRFTGSDAPALFHVRFGRAEG